MNYSQKAGKKWVRDLESPIYGYRIHLRTSGARRFGGRRYDIGPHYLVEPTCPGESRAVRPRNVAARQPVRGFYRWGIEKHMARPSGAYFNNGSVSTTQSQAKAELAIRKWLLISHGER